MVADDSLDVGMSSAPECFDLATLDTSKKSNEGGWMEVKHPITGKSIPDAKILLAGTDSEIWRSAQRERADGRMAAGLSGAVLTTAEIDAEGTLILAKCTLGWSGIAIGGPTPMTFSRENAGAAYSRFRWLRDQVNEYVGARANFLP
jgi:hypothetical protein